MKKGVSDAYEQGLVNTNGAYVGESGGYIEIPCTCCLCIYLVLHISCRMVVWLGNVREHCDSPYVIASINRLILASFILDYFGILLTWYTYGILIRNTKHTKLANLQDSPKIKNTTIVHMISLGGRA